MLANKVEEIGEAKEVLRVLSLDKEARVIYEAREKALMDKYSALANAKEEGKLEGKEEEKYRLAKSMLDNGIDIETVVNITKLSKEELKAIKNR